MEMGKRQNLTKGQKTAKGHQRDEPVPLITIYTT